MVELCNYRISQSRLSVPVEWPEYSAEDDNVLQFDVHSDGGVRVAEHTRNTRVIDCGRILVLRRMIVLLIFVCLFVIVISITTNFVRMSINVRSNTGASTIGSSATNELAPSCPRRI